MSKIKVPIDPPTESELGDTPPDIQRRENREEADKQQRRKRRKPEGRILHNRIFQTEETVAEKRPRTERSESEMDTECGGEGSQTSTKCQSRCKKGHIVNIYLTDLDEEAIVDFVNDHEELCDKTHRKFKDKATKDCLW